MKNLVSPKKGANHHVGWWIVLSVSFLLLFSFIVPTIGGAPDISLSITGPTTVLPNTQAFYTFETMVSDVPIFSFPLQATIKLPSGVVENITTFDSLQGYKTTEINFTQVGTYVIDASVSIGGVTQTQQKIIVVSIPDPIIELEILQVELDSFSGSIQTDTSNNITIFSTLDSIKNSLCTVSCESPSCVFTCDATFAYDDVVKFSAELGAISSSQTVSLLSFQERVSLIQNISSLNFIEGENNSFTLDEVEGVTLRAINLNSSQLHIPSKANGEYIFSTLTKGSYVLEAFKLDNQSYVVDSINFQVQSSPNVISINPVQNSLVYAPQEDALYLRTKINIEDANRDIPILLEQNSYFDSVFLLRDDISIRLSQENGFYIVPRELLSSVLEFEIKLSGSPFNPTSILPKTKPTIELRTSFNTREFIINTNATDIFRYTIPQVSSFSYVWDMVDNRFINDYFVGRNNTLIIYTRSKDILLLESTLSTNTTQYLKRLFSTDRPLEYDAKSDIELPLDDLTKLVSVQAISRNGLAQDISFQDSTLFTSPLPNFEYLLLLEVEKQNVTGIYPLPVQFIPDNTLSISRPSDLGAYAGEQATFSFVISNKLDETSLLDIIYNDDLVTLSTAESELDDNNKNGFLDTGILIPGDNMVITATIDVPSEYNPGTIIPLTFKFASSKQEIFRTLNLVVEKKAFEEGKRLNYFDIDVFELSYEGDNLSIGVRNNNLVDEIVVLDVIVTADENTFQKTIPLQIPADGIVKESITLSGEKIFASAHVYFENGVQDTVPNNNKRQLIFNDAWLDDQREYRLVIPISEKSGYDFEIFNLRAFVSLIEEVELESLRAITTNFADGVFSYADTPYELLLFDEEINEGHIMFGVPNVHANEQKNIYLYFDTQKIIEESLPIKSNIEDWQFETIIDNRDDEVSYVGSWFDSASTKGYYGLDYVYDLNLGKGDKLIVVSPNKPPSSYEVYFNSPSSSNFASNVPVTIVHDEGTTNIDLNQRIGNDGWKYIGLYDFSPLSKISISNENTDGFVIFDAIKFIPIAQYIQETTTQARPDAYSDNISLNVSVENNSLANTTTNISIVLIENITGNASLNISLNESTNISLNNSQTTGYSDIIVYSPEPGFVYLDNRSIINISLNTTTNIFLEVIDWFTNTTLSWNISNTSDVYITTNGTGNFSLHIFNNSNDSIIKEIPFVVIESIPRNISTSIVSVEGNDTHTSSAQVILIHTGEYIVDMRLSCDNASWSSWSSWKPITRNFNLLNRTLGCGFEASTPNNISKNITIYFEMKNPGAIISSQAQIMYLGFVNKSSALDNISLNISFDNVTNTTAESVLNVTVSNQSDILNNSINKSEITSNASVIVKNTLVELGKPVSWTLETTATKNVTIPKQAYDVSIESENKIIDAQELLISVNGTNITLDDFQKLSLGDDTRKELAKVQKEKKEGGFLRKLDILGEESSIKKQLVEVSDLEERTKFNDTEVVELKINSSQKNITKVTYVTPAPLKEEINISRQKKQVVIASDFHYKNISSWSDIKETPQDRVKLFWYIDGKRTDVSENEEIDLKKIDTNNNGLIDRLEWITPHTSTQVFEIEIILLDSIDILDSNKIENKLWLVTAETNGAKNLSLQAVRGMYPSQTYCGSFEDFNNSITAQDLEEIRQGYAYSLPENSSESLDVNVTGRFASQITSSFQWTCEHQTIITYVIDVRDIFDFNTTITYGKESHVVSTTDEYYFNLEVSINVSQVNNPDTDLVDVTVSAAKNQAPLLMENIEITLFSIDNFPTSRYIESPGYEYEFAINKKRNLYNKVLIKASYNGTTQSKTILLNPPPIDHNFMFGENVEFDVSDVSSVVLFDGQRRVSDAFSATIDSGKIVLSTNSNAIQPGRYQIEVTHSDYVENIWFTYGLVSINTHKPLYHIGDDATISLVVLDKNGFVLTNVPVELKTTAPSGKVYLQSTENEQISVVDNVYRTNLLLDEEGKYLFEAVAQTPDGLVSITSFVNTQQEYPLDILRDVPFTFDPWITPYTNNFTFVEYDSMGSFSVTEIIPSSFLILDDGGAQVSYEDDGIHLTWNDVFASDELSYTAQPPLITPYLYELGNVKIEYFDDNNDAKIFYENRTWILAIDPLAEGAGLQFFGQVTAAFVTPKYYPVTPSTGARGDVDDVGYSASTGIFWIDAASHPFKKEVIVIWQDDDQDVHAAVWDGTSWGNTVDLTAATGTDYKAMDVAYTTNTGTGMVVYGENANNPRYRTWNGTDWSGELQASNIGGGPRFMRLVASPDPTSDELILAVADANADVNVQEWDGSSWGGVTEVTATCWSTSFCFDVAYETSTYDALIAYRGGTASSVYYNTYNAGAGTWSGQSTTGGLSGDIRVIQMDSHPTTDWILAGIVDDSTQNYNLFMWTGAGWTDMGTMSTSVNYENTQNFDVAFNKKTGIGYTLYGEGANVRYRTIPNGSTVESAEQTIGSMSYTMGNIRLESSLFQDTMYASLMTIYWDLGFTSWNGSSWDFTGINVGGGTGTSQRYYRMLATTEYYTVEAPTSTNFSLNVSNGANLLRTDDVLAYSQWNAFRDTLQTPAYLSHNGDGTNTNYTATVSGNWANYTFDISDTVEFSHVGRVDINNIFASDLGLYGETGYAGWFFIYDNSNLTDMIVPVTTVNQSQSIDIACQAYDTDLLEPIIDYTVYLYRNGSFISSDKTNGTGWAEFTTSVSVPGSYEFNCSIGNTGYYYAVIGENELSSTVTVLDSTPPTINVLQRPDGYETVTWPVWSNFSVSDTYSGIDNCTINYFDESNTSIGAANFSAPAQSTELGYALTRSGYESIKWFVSCYDDSINSNYAQSTNRTFSVVNDTSPPTIQLISPPEAATIGENVSFLFNATDKLHDVGSCDFYYDGLINATNSSVVEGEVMNITLYLLDPGAHTWRVRCNDDSPNNNSVFSAIRSFTVGDDEVGPLITVTAPANLSTDTDGNTNFTYIPDDFQSATDNCSLYVDGLLNQTDNSLIDGVESGFYISPLAEGSYTWFLSCTDDSANSNQRNTSLYTLYVDYDFDNPLVTLIEPRNLFQSTSGDIDFIYNVTDENAIDSCSLYINATVNQTDSSITRNINQSFSLTSIPIGDYNWTVSCVDTTDTANSFAASELNFSVGPDTIGPGVTLIGPADNDVDTDGEITFSYIADDVTSGIDNCEVFVNDSSVDVDNSVAEGIVQFMGGTLTEGSYEWYINCTDDAPAINVGQSTTWFFNVSLKYTTNYTVSLDDHYVAIGEIEQPEITFYDNFGGSLSSAPAYLFAIRNLGLDNQTLPWWNESWKRRFEIPVTSSNDDFENGVVNITLDTATLISDGYLNSDCSDLRFADQGNNRLEYYFYDDNAACNDANSKIVILFNNQWKDVEHRLGVYFNNTAATFEPTYRDDYFVVDNFEDNDTFTSGYWAFGSVTPGGTVEQYTNAARASDGVNSSRLTVDCATNTVCEYAQESTSFSKTIFAESPLNLTWGWRLETAATGTLRFYLDGVQQTTYTSAAYAVDSVTIPAGSHTLKWQYDIQTGVDTDFYAYVDEIVVTTNNIVLGSPTTQSEPVEELASKTTDISGEATFSWNTSSYPYGNYSLTGYATKDAYWPDNGYYNVYLGPDVEVPTYISWKLNVSDGDTVFRGSLVNASVIWYDNIALDSAMLEHNGTTTFINYSATSFNGAISGIGSYILDSGNLTEFSTLGRVYANTMYVNDTTGNINNTEPAKYFDIYSYAVINDSYVPNASRFDNETLNYTCSVVDDFTNLSIANYPVKFYFNGSYKATSLTNASGYASYVFSSLVVGMQPAECLIENNLTKYYYAGSPSSSITYINVTDTIPPQIELITPSNGSVRTTISTAFAVRPTDDTLQSCSLYGDWGSGWSLKETKYDFVSGFINYFTVVQLYNAEHSWYVSCRDSGLNINTSETWVFNVSVPAPIITLQTPADDIGYSAPLNESFTYYVQDDVDIDNCSIFINGALNYTNSSITVNASNNFYVELPTYDEYSWTVQCYNNETILGVTGNRQIYIMSWSMLSPAPGDQVDRDNSSTIISEYINITAEDAGGSSLINVSFYTNLSTPTIVGNNDLLLGTALSNGSGIATLLYYPISDRYPGTYVSWANATIYNFTTFNTTSFDVFAGLNLAFAQNSQDPNASYNWSDIITVVANATTVGLVNQSMLNSTYNLLYNLTLYSPSFTQNISYNLSFSNPNWSINFNSSIFNEIGIWNFSLDANADYYYINTTQSKSISIVDEIPPVVSLLEPANNSYLLTNQTDFNISVDEFFTDSCQLWGNWSGWSSKENISYVNGNNSFSAINFTDGVYVWDALCNDTSSNSAWSSNGNFTFTIDTTLPDVQLMTPKDNAILPPGITNLYYNVSELDVIANCSLYIDGMLNQTNTSITKNVAQNFTTSLAYGEYDWNISCTTNNLQVGSSATRKIYVLSAEVTSPTNGSSYDRDGQLATPDSITFESNISSALPGLNISYYIRLGAGSDIFIGSNNTDASGESVLSYNPVSTLVPGNYTWWSTIENTTTNSTNQRDFLLIGSYQVTFESGSLNPDVTYTYGDNITISAVLSSYGFETPSIMNATYNASLNATLYTPRTNVSLFTRNLLFNQSSWIDDFNSTILISHGNWNVSLNGSVNTTYFSLVSLDNRLFFFNVTGYGVPSINLTAPLNDSTIFYSNPFVTSTNITFNWTVIDAIDANVSCNLSINSVLNQSNIVSLNNSVTSINSTFSSGGIYTWNVTCSDYANTNTSQTYEFKIVPPDANISGKNYTISGGNPVVFERVNFTTNYSNFYDEPIVGACNISFSDGISDMMVYNTTTLLYDYNRTMTDEGILSWNVSCGHPYYNNITSSLYTLSVNKAQLYVLAPSNGTSLDRDETDGVVSDSVNIIGSISLAPAGVSVDFFAQRNDPDAGEVYFLGSNLTNSTGHVLFTFNPNATIRAGNYTVYANNSNIEINQSVWVNVLGSLFIEFFDNTDLPNNTYNRNTSVPFHFNITSFGIENATDLDTYYLNDSAFAFAISPSLSIQLNTSLQRYQNNVFNGTIFFNDTAELGFWNVSGNISDTYFFVTSSSTRLMNITKLKANLTAWDQYDAQGGYVAAYVGESISFFANYTDEFGSYINLPSCNFTFSDGSNIYGTPNGTLQLHIVSNKLFFTPGYFSWNATCENNLYEQKIFNENIRIYPKTNTSVRKTINSIMADTMVIALNLTNYASYSYIIDGYDFVHYPEYIDFNYSFGPNATNSINSGEYVGQATKFNITVPNDSSTEITYYINASGDYNASDLYIVGV